VLADVCECLLDDPGHLGGSPRRQLRDLALDVGRDGHPEPIAGVVDERGQVRDEVGIRLGARAERHDGEASLGDRRVKGGADAIDRLPELGMAFAEAVRDLAEAELRQPQLLREPVVDFTGEARAFLEHRSENL
jgi:hypothetical protein